jgi:hypothetical protein
VLSIGMLGAGLVAVLQFQGWELLPWVILVFVVGGLVEGSVLTPRLVGGQIGLHPVAVIFAVMAGATLRLLRHPMRIAGRGRGHGAGAPCRAELPCVDVVRRSRSEGRDLV